MIQCSHAPLGLLLCHTLLQLLNVALSGHNSLTNRLEQPHHHSTHTSQLQLHGSASVNVSHHCRLFLDKHGLLKGLNLVTQGLEKWGATTKRCNGNGVLFL